MARRGRRPSARVERGLARLLDARRGIPSREEGGFRGRGPPASDLRTELVEGASSTRVEEASRREAALGRASRKGVEERDVEGLEARFGFRAAEKYSTDATKSSANMVMLLASTTLSLGGGNSL